MKKSELKQLIKETLSETFDEMPIDLYMAAMSHLSDLQEQISDPEINGMINFIKIIILEIKKGKREMSQGELNALYQQWGRK